jgi:hypothetical protein
MRILLSLLLAAFAADPPPADPQQAPAAVYKTAKTLAVLEQCLTDSLSKIGDVTAVKFDSSTTLMLREGTEAPMLIDIAPPSVTVTTRFAYGTRSLVKGCI